MMTLKNLTLYSVSTECSENGILFLRDEDGNDWYESQKGFSSDTLKIAYNSEGVICSAYTDVSKLWPVNMSVTEINVSGLPEGFVVDGNWVYDGKAVKARTYSQAELIAKATAQREQLMAQASAVIAPLQDAVDLDLATDDEEIQLAAWKKYRVLLSRIDCSDPAGITWPETPAK